MSVLAGHEVDVVSEPGHVSEPLGVQWQDLADRCGSTFASWPGYGLSWWASLGRGELAITTVRREGELVALAPLHQRSIMGQPVLRWLGHGLGTVGEVLAVDGEAVSALWDALADRGIPLQLTHARADHEAILALRRDPRWSVGIEVDDHCPVVALPGAVTAKDLRSTKTLRTLERRRRRLMERGTPVSIEVIDDVDGVSFRWPDIVRVAALADVGRDRVNLCSPPYHSFTREALLQAAAGRNVVIVGLLHGGAWVAHHIWLRVGRTLYEWITRFDPAIGSISPGLMLMEWVVDHHEALAVDSLDLQIGQSRWKREWTRRGYDVATVTATPTRRLGLVRARLAVAASIGDQLRSLPRLCSRVGATSLQPD